MVFVGNPIEFRCARKRVGKQNAGNPLSHRRIYLREAGEYVGPFREREDAERFLMLVRLFGGNCEGVEIVEIVQWHCNLP